MSAGLSCSVCGSSGFKYHCPSCRATSCSLSCFKAHKNQCSHPETEATTAALPPAEPEVIPVGNPPLSDILTQDPRVQTLFEQYPNLRGKLKYIFDTAINDDMDHDPSKSNPRRKNYQTSPQQRMARALRILGGQLQSDTAETSGLKAFAELVAELNSKGLEGDSEHANA